MTALDTIIRDNRTRNGAALPSICSAHPDVLTASLLLAEELDRPLLIEATSNQVNHQGGYTGMTPSDFIATLRKRAEALGTDADRLMFGGDHLGPQAWKHLAPEQAMQEARDMISAYVRAGFSKIHLDCSEGCAGEPAALTDAPAAARAAELAAVAEAAAADPAQLRYIIGTEVPPPGGARHDDEGIAPTPPERASATLIAHRDAFAAAGQQEAFGRVRGLVVQPGLEFAPAHVDRFDMSSPDHLSDVLAPYPDLCFEAHSTDYQYPEVFAELAKRNFAILKVGPALTFAWREALYVLSHIDSWMNGTAHISDLTEHAMTASAGYWKSHYHGDPAHQRLMRHFGLADRIRYYWAQPDVFVAVQDLRDRMNTTPPPMPVLAQYFDDRTIARAQSLPICFADALLVAHVQRALLPYYTGAA
ncbi:class II D-tagatose-bisphosphate aldolase, non-catalytic subunit [Paracoccus sp. Z330]|uniref:Class II D-tagatose-bisphosphate aldolase, non-catalytic subunit n=1 Tax=Paracoccus onchidii TaxID=3017813 RepID=A0ABT4ZG23_9RHOB|nr:class II D-tagatose-bisphosphate aldolase, non-catalytic subunit [Paracoccus onchidii]MDB6178266.1 class II D-tagatose-bisphosphate aldolase, non-catalytic subunit [Paracoccus onchidii]